MFSSLPRLKKDYVLLTSFWFLGLCKEAIALTKALHPCHELDTIMAARAWSANIPPSDLEWSEVYWGCNQIKEREMRRGVFRIQVDESSFFIMHEGEAQRKRALKHTCSFCMTWGLGRCRQPVTQPSSLQERGTVKHCGRNEPETACRWQLRLAVAWLSLQSPQRRISHRPLLSASSLFLLLIEPPPLVVAKIFIAVSRR